MRTPNLYYFLLVVLFWVQDATAQLGPNIIPNYSFEALELDVNGVPACPSSPGWITVSEQWGSAYGSVDYFNACSNENWPNFGVPDNRCGSQVASTGVAYSLLLGYVNYPNYEDSREFLWMELSDSLKKGQGYYWEAQVSLADSMNFAMSQLGVLFSHENTRLWQQENFFDAVPQIQNPKDSLLDNKNDWMKVSGQFVASGGEKFMTIGFFNRDTAENIVRVSDYPYITTLWEQSAYYIDDVVLKEDNSIGIAARTNGRCELHPNPSDDQVQIFVTGSNTELEHVTIQDQLGNVVAVQKVSGLKSTIHVEHLYSGVYVVSVKLRGGSVVRSRLLKN